MQFTFRSFVATAALSLMTLSTPAQSTRIHVGGLPTNLSADWSRLFWSPGPAAEEFYLLAPFSGAPAGSFVFDMFGWDAHPMMQPWFPNGWFEVRFAFPEWAYLSNAPCGLQPAPNLSVPHGGIESTYGYGGPLLTGPVVGIHQPLPGWVLGNAGRSWISGHCTNVFFPETFGLWLTDFFGNSLTGCVAGTPVSWVAVRVRLSLVLH